MYNNYDNINTFATKHKVKYKPGYNNNNNNNFRYRIKMTSIKEAWNYIKETVPAKKTIIANIVVGFGVISINMAFYPFAFDNLGVDEKGWGFMMSIFYGSNLIAME